MKDFLPQTIICPIDFSQSSEECLRLAVGLSACESTKPKIVAMYADLFEPPIYFTATQDGDLMRHLEQSRSIMVERLKTFVEPYAAGGEIQTLVVERAPAQAIIEKSRELAADLVIMGTHGRSGFSRFMMGSVAERVLAETVVPVLTVRMRPNVEKPLAIRKVLCPVNYTETARKALEAASALAVCLNAELTVLNVVENEIGTNGKHEAYDKLCRWVPEGAHPACNLKTLVRSGNAAEEIIEITSRDEDYLIVIGAERKIFADTTVLGQTVVRVTRHANCPVLTVPNIG